MFSHTLVSVHLLDRKGNHFSSNPLINLPKGGKKNKKKQPRLLLNQFHVSDAKASVQPFSRSESRCSCPALNPDASFLQRPAKRSAANEDQFYECVRSTLSQPASYASCSSKLQIRPPSVTSLTPSGYLCCFKGDKSLFMAEPISSEVRLS